MLWMILGLPVLHEELLIFFKLTYWIVVIHAAASSVAPVSLAEGEGWWARELCHSRAKTTAWPKVRA